METDAGDYAIGDNRIIGGSATAEGKKKKEVNQVAGITFGVPAQLEPFVLLGKSARGAGAAALIAQATSAPGVYVFSELLELPSIKDLGPCGDPLSLSKQLAKHEQHANSYELLEIFAYGTWSDYLAKKATLPTLKPAQETKLKHLTILSLSTKSRVIPYSLLLSSLDLPDNSTLEDLLIDAFYSNVLSGRLDQAEQRLEVISGVGRDVRPDSSPSSSTSAVATPAATVGGDEMEVEDATATSTTAVGTTSMAAPSIGTLTTSLESWLETINVLLSSLNHHLATIHSNSINAISLQKDHEKAVSIAVQEAQKKPAGKEKASSGSSSNVLGGGGSGGTPDNWGALGDAGTGMMGSIKSRAMGAIFGSGAGGSKEEMDVDGPGPSGSMRSPGNSGRTRKRGRTATGI